LSTPNKVYDDDEEEDDPFSDSLYLQWGCFAIWMGD